ncbi:MAG: hypothetical protein V2J24_05535 [Pseudomonadales bacterium]|jgi:L-ascorbate metabolism protein UlaG (beta-lactamase superfamily)|nr:hypothetical protein [Pseudomonadales bacterium]
MKLEFVAHASVVLRHGSIALMSDPWLEGTSFDDGWALLSRPVFTADDFAAITHIWISHEHPDHFSPRTLAMIPEEHRQRITLLFHRSEDRKVVQYCEKAGFARIIELDPGKWLELGDDMSIRCDRWQGSDDSWLLTRTPDATVLNLNDCQANTEEEMRFLHGETGDVDVLLTQYSISSWDGNAEEEERRQAGAQAMIDRACAQARMLNAEWVVPFASFIWFCHEENSFMNSALRPVGDVAHAISERTEAKPVVLYPGDRWTIGEPHDSSSAIARYEADVASIANRELIRSEPVDCEQLMEIAARFTERVKLGRSPLRMRIGGLRRGLLHRHRAKGDSLAKTALGGLLDILRLRGRPAMLWISDLGRAMKFDLIDGLRPSSAARDSCDIQIGSAALAFGMRFLWGGETLFINGRFKELYPGGRETLFQHLGLASSLNHEEGASPRPI